MMIVITLPEWDCVVDYTEREGIPKNKSGVYVLYGKNDEVLYVGKSENLFARIVGHFEGRGANTTGGLYFYFYKATMFFESDALMMDIYETYAINTLCPSFNQHKVITYKSINVKRLSKVPEEHVDRYMMHICKGFRNDGQKCRCKARKSGYCTVHEKKFSQLTG